MRIFGLLRAVIAPGGAPPGAGRLPGTNRLGHLSVAAVALALVLTPIEPADATILNIGDLLEDGFFANPNWRSELFPCEFWPWAQLNWNLAHQLPMPPPILVPPHDAPPHDVPAYGAPSTVETAPDTPPPDIVPPPVVVVPPPVVTDVPEPSTWLMMFIGLAALGWFKLRKAGDTRSRSRLSPDRITS
jgi:hypothetical protein